MRWALVWDAGWTRRYLHRCGHDAYAWEVEAEGSIPFGSEAEALAFLGTMRALGRFLRSAPIRAEERPWPAR